MTNNNQWLTEILESFRLQVLAEYKRKTFNYSNDEAEKLILQKISEAINSDNYNGAWGIKSLDQVLANMRVAENGGDFVECSDALEAVLKELRDKLGLPDLGKEGEK